MLNAGSEDLSHHLEGQLTNLLQETAHVDPISLYCPLTQELTVSTKDPVKEQGRINSLDALPNVIIPQHTMYIKTYNQALTGDIRRAIYEKQSKAEVEWSYPQTSLQDDKSMYTLSHPQELYLEPFVQGNQMNETLL
ncbi:hypothetical protein G6F56_006821 [Rhizopus delemar]|nr:hypothetical protein G6F56_006821 [Rhizopus delemar]